MDEYLSIVERIVEGIREKAREGCVSPADLGRIVLGDPKLAIEKINLYPGQPDNRCYRLAIFISLSSPSYIKGTRGHLSFRGALEKIVQHMQGMCRYETKVALFITDSWDPSAIEEWVPNLRQISRDNFMGIYLFSKGTLNKMAI